MSGVAQCTAEIHDPLDLVESQRAVSRNALGVLDFCVAGDFVMTGSPGEGFGRLDQRSTDALILRFRFDIPALDECDRRRRATGWSRPFASATRTTGALRPQGLAQTREVAPT